MTSGGLVTAFAPDGVPEIREGDDLASTLLSVLGEGFLVDGDILVVTSKAVSKAEGRARTGDREQWIDAETQRPVARRGPTRIVRNRLGLTMAAAGVDASNVEAGTVMLLPEDPDASARRLRHAVLEHTGANVGVVITDTAGRTWREGQTDIAIGAAGVVVLESFAGRLDAHGNELAVTAPAVADEVASAVELAQGKLGARPCGVLRGRPDLVLPPGQDGPGASSLIRPDGADLFGWGAREAVIRAVAGQPDDLAPFGSAVTAPEMVDALTRAGLSGSVVEGGEPAIVVAAEHRALASVVAFAHGWEVASTAEADTDLRLRPATP